MFGCARSLLAALIIVVPPPVGDARSLSLSEVGGLLLSNLTARAVVAM
jgi:hypothetical protein